MLNPTEEEVQLITLDEDGKCQYGYDVGPSGVIYWKFYKTVPEWSLKHGNHSREAQEVWLVPYKQHIMSMEQSSKVGMTDGLLPVGSFQSLVPPTELDPGAKKVIFRAG